MSAELRNIPALWNALSLCIAQALYISLMAKRSDHSRVRIVIAAAIMVAEYGLLHITMSLENTQFNLVMLTVAIVTAIPFFVVTSASVSVSLFYCARAFVLGSFIGSLSWQMYIYIASNYMDQENMLFETVFMLASFALLAGLFYALERRHKKEIENMTMSGQACISAIAVAYLIYVLSSISFSTLRTPFGGTTYAEAFNLRTIVLLAGVALLYAQHLQICEHNMFVESETLRNILNTQYANMQLSQESIDIVNQKYHDLKHQIALLRSEISGEEKLEFLDRMENDIQVYEAMNKTGNQYLDTILTSKGIHCTKEGITLTSVVDGALINFMDAMDISAMFGNALDNAIEAVSKLPSDEQKLIHLSVSKEKSFVRIHVENRCDEVILNRSQFPQTTKLDKRYHGFGIKSIDNIAQKYGGSCTVHVNEGWFELRILIPLKNK